MTLKSVLRQIIEKSEDSEYLEVIYAELINGKFELNSDAIIIQLNEEERELKTKIISEKYCPKKECFYEVIFVQEMLEGLSNKSTENEIDKRLKIIVDYVENDA